MAIADIPNVWYRELDGSPTINIDEPGTTAERRFVCAWRDALVLADALRGIFFGDLPETFPGSPVLVCRSVRVAPWPKDPGADNDEYTTIPAAGLPRTPAPVARTSVTRMMYRRAVVTASYETIDPIEYDTGAETVGAGQKGLVYMGGGGPPTYLQAGALPPRTMPYTTIGIKRRGLKTNLIGTIIGLQGKVNAGPFDEFDVSDAYGTIGSNRQGMTALRDPAPPETVMFVGAKTRAVVDVSSKTLWDIELIFRRRPVSWNRVWNPGPGEWQQVGAIPGGGTVGTPVVVTPYQTADFSPLLVSS